MTDQDILNFIISKNTGNILKFKLNKLNDDHEIKIYLKNRYKDFVSYPETIYRIKNNIDIKPICPICSKPVQYKFRKYVKTCGDPLCIKKFKNLNSGFHKKEIQDKVKQTIKIKYGVENPYSIKEINEKAVRNSQTNKAKRKRENTCLELYGVKNGGGSKQAIEKIKNKWKNKSQNDLNIITNKRHETCYRKYNSKSYQSTNEFKQLMSIKMSSEQCLSKRRQTILERYGNETYNNQEKRNKTLKENKSYAKSKYEDQSYELLKEKYPDVIRQYSSELYPFNCDFYIPSLDLYIECNYSQYHCKHPFNKNNKDDLLYLEELKERAAKSERHKIGKKSQYDNMIYTWTDLDVRKFNIGIQNNLNYKVFYKLNDLKKYIEEQ